MKKVLTDENLLFVFGRISVNETQFIRNNFLTMALKSLKQIQEQTDNLKIDCLHPEEFFNEIFPEGIGPSGILEQLVAQVWEDPGQLEEILDRLIKTINDPNYDLTFLMS